MGPPLAASDTAPRSAPPTIQSSPGFAAASAAFARRDFAAALSAIETLSRKPNLSSADREYLNRQRDICKSAVGTPLAASPLAALDLGMKRKGKTFRIIMKTNPHWHKRLWPQVQPFAAQRQMQIWHETHDTDQINLQFLSEKQKTCFIMIIPSDHVPDEIEVFCNCTHVQDNGERAVSGSLIGALPLNASQKELEEILAKAKNWGDACSS